MKTEPSLKVHEVYYCQHINVHSCISKSIGFHPINLNILIHILVVLYLLHSPIFSFPSLLGINIARIPIRLLKKQAFNLGGGNSHPESLEPATQFLEVFLLHVILELFFRWHHPFLQCLFSKKLQKKQIIQSAFLWWFQGESNPRHKDFQSFALPTELQNHWLRGKDLNQRPPGYGPDELPGCSTSRCF